MGKHKPKNAVESPVPAGMYVEVDVDLIDEGQFKKRLNEALARGFRDLMEWEESTGRSDGALQVKALIKVSRMSKSDTLFHIEAEVNGKIPPVRSDSCATGGEKRLICQPEGTRDDDPDQIKLFDRRGRPKGGIDLSTGEVIDPAPDVVGSVGS